MGDGVPPEGVTRVRAAYCTVNFHAMHEETQPKPRELSAMITKAMRHFTRTSLRLTPESRSTPPSGPSPRPNRYIHTSSATAQLGSLADGGGSTSSQASRGRGAATRRCDPRARATGARVRHGPSHAAPPRLPVSQKGGASAGASLTLPLLPDFLRVIPAILG